MRRNGKIVVILIIMSSCFIVLLHCNDNIDNERSSAYKRMSLLESAVENLYQCYTNNKLLLTQNHEFALFSFSDKNLGHDPVEFFNLYYKIIETYNGSGQIGMLEYLGTDTKFSLFFGVDFPSDRLIVLESETRFYKPHLFTREGTLNNRNLIQYLISQQWRNEQWEVQNRKVQSPLWKSTIGAKFDVYHIPAQFRIFLGS